MNDELSGNGKLFYLIGHIRYTLTYLFTIVCYPCWYKALPVITPPLIIYAFPNRIFKDIYSSDFEHEITIKTNSLFYLKQTIIFNAINSAVITILT